MPTTPKTKQCSKCRRTLPWSAFYREGQAAGGIRSTCCDCDRARHLLYDRNPVNKILAKRRKAKWWVENREQIRDKRRRKYHDMRGTELCYQARFRAKKSGAPFTLTAEDVADISRRIELGVCELTGVQLSLAERRGPLSPSIDRRVPALGYTRENTRVVCFAVNCALGNWGEEALREIVSCWIASGRGVFG
jgi:hypothetical protein